MILNEAENLKVERTASITKLYEKAKSQSSKLLITHTPNATIVMCLYKDTEYDSTLNHVSTQTLDHTTGIASIKPLEINLNQGLPERFIMSKAQYQKLSLGV